MQCLIREIEGNKNIKKRQKSEIHPANIGVYFRMSQMSIKIARKTSILFVLFTLNSFEYYMDRSLPNKDELLNF